MSNAMHHVRLSPYVHVNVLEDARHAILSRTASSQPSASSHVGLPYNHNQPPPGSWVMHGLAGWPLVLHVCNVHMSSELVYTYLQQLSGWAVWLVTDTSQPSC